MARRKLQLPTPATPPTPAATRCRGQVDGCDFDRITDFALLALPQHAAELRRLHFCADHYVVVHRALARFAVQLPRFTP